MSTILWRHIYEHEYIALQPFNPANLWTTSRVRNLYFVLVVAT